MFRISDLVTAFIHYFPTSKLLILSFATLELASICLTAVINCTNSHLSTDVSFPTAIDMFCSVGHAIWSDLMYHFFSPQNWMAFVHLNKRHVMLCYNDGFQLQRLWWFTYTTVYSTATNVLCVTFLNGNVFRQHVCMYFMYKLNGQPTLTSVTCEPLLATFTSAPFPSTNRGHLLSTSLRISTVVSLTDIHRDLSTATVIATVRRPTSSRVRLTTRCDWDDQTPGVLWHQQSDVRQMLQVNEMYVSSYSEVLDAVLRDGAYADMAHLYAISAAHRSAVGVLYATDTAFGTGEKSVLAPMSFVIMWSMMQHQKDDRRFLAKHFVLQDERPRGQLADTVWYGILEFNVPLNTV